MAATRVIAATPTRPSSQRSIVASLRSINVLSASTSSRVATCFNSVSIRARRSPWPDLPFPEPDEAGGRRLGNC